MLNMLQEKDSAMEMWQAAVQEVERLEQETKVGAPLCRGYNPGYMEINPLRTA